jgi:hypothetical protein
MKVKLKLVDFTVKTERFPPGHDKPWPHSEIHNETKLKLVRLALVGRVSLVWLDILG